MNAFITLPGEDQVTSSAALNKGKFKQSQAEYSIFLEVALLYFYILELLNILGCQFNLSDLLP